MKAKTKLGNMRLLCQHVFLLISNPSSCSLRQRRLDATPRQSLAAPRMKSAAEKKVRHGNVFYSQGLDLTSTQEAFIDETEEPFRVIPGDTWLLQIFETYHCRERDTGSYLRDHRPLLSLVLRRPLAVDV